MMKIYRVDEGRIPLEFKNELSLNEVPLKYLESPPYSLLATNDRLLISRKHKKGTLGAFGYRSISSVEHKRIIELKILGFIFLLFGLSAFFILLPEFEYFLGGAMYGLETAINISLPFTPRDATLVLGGIFGFLGILMIFPFIGSLSYRLVVYYSSGGSINIPLKMSSDTLELLSVLHEGLKKYSTTSKEDVEKIVENKLGSLMETRLALEQQLLTIIKAKAQNAKTPEQQEKVMDLLDRSVMQLEEHDRVIEDGLRHIESDLKKVGLTKDELFRKYRIRPPKEGFIEALIQDERVDDVLKDLLK